MTIGQFIRWRMVYGGAALAVYGGWVACARLPGAEPVGMRLGASAWAIAVFAAVGMTIAAGTAAAALLGTWPIRRSRYRPAAAAVIETAIVVPLFGWLILNEFVYSTTSEVLGLDTFSLIWHNTRAVFENAWAMGARYLLTAGGLTLTAIVVVNRLSARSFRSLCSPARVPYRSRLLRFGGSMTGVLVLTAALLGWQYPSASSEALTVVFRSAPPLRAFNLARTWVGNELAGPAPTHFGEPIIPDAEYQARMGSPRKPAPDVVLIVLESVSAKALHCYGYPRADITPNMDALAADGTLFEHCLAAASFSSYGLVSLQTSLHMLRAEHYDHFVDLSFPYMSLPMALKLAGYELAVFSSGNEAWDSLDQFCPPKNYDVYFTHDTTPQIPKPDCMRMDDHYAVEAFEAWLSKRADPRPFYCRFYLQSPHFNYEVPEPWASHYLPVPPMYSNGDGIIHIPPDVLPLLKNRYDNSMRYADYWVGRIRAALERAGAFDNTVIVIIADHGEAFMEHGLARHGVHLWEEMIHIPLIFHVGERVRRSLPHPLPSRVPGTVSGIDIAPTVAGLVGICPHPSWQGLDVLAPGYTGRDRPIFSILQLTRWQELVCINKLKYMYDLTEAEPHLFDLQADAGERTDLVRERPQLAAALREMLAGWSTYQMDYYAPANRPFTHYVGRYQPDSALLQRLHVESAGR
jgi:arylsulfatase A-like enzyme